MEQYIKKSALVVEIERIKEHDSHIHYDDDMLVNRDMSVRYHLLEYLLDFINTIEVKDVDLEKEIDEKYRKDTSTLKIREKYAELAKYFFELGLKTKGE